MEINEIICSRRTVRKFKQKPLEINNLKKYIEAARLAPSAGNLQPLKYILVADEEMRNKVFSTLKWAGYLAPAYNPAESERPMAYVVVCADASICKNGYDMDVGAAVENIIISAAADGVGACWFGSVDRPVLKKYLNLPDSLTISCVVALGYPDEQPKEVKVAQDGSIKYYLEDNTLCVPKRSVDEVIVEIY